MRGCVLPIDRTLIDKLKILGLLLICVIFFRQCVTGLQQCVSSEAVELISLLGRYEIEGLLYAHDRIGEQSTIGPPLGAPDGDGSQEIGLDDDGIGGGMGAPPESAFLSPSQVAQMATNQMGDKTFKIIRLEKTNEPLVIKTLLICIILVV